MKVLFVTFKNLSMGDGGTSSIAFLYALADAGYQVYVIASKVEIKTHKNIHILHGEGDKRSSRKRIRMAFFRAMKGRSYPIIHAVDEAVLYAARFAKSRRCKIVYEASRCFSGTYGVAPFWYWRFFSGHYSRSEQKMLAKVSVVFSSCDELSMDLKRIYQDVPIVQVADIPAQLLMPVGEDDRNAVQDRFNKSVSFIVVCTILTDNLSDWRTILLAARKIIETIPNAGFVFKGMLVDEARELAGNLDIRDHCIFLVPEESKSFLEALSVAHAALFVPDRDNRYLHPDILTLLKSPALVVIVKKGASGSVLSDSNCIRVDYTAVAIADGLLRAHLEPLLSFGTVADAHQLIADHFSFSSFKHKVRMAYHGLAKVN